MTTPRSDNAVFMQLLPGTVYESEDLFFLRVKEHILQYRLLEDDLVLCSGNVPDPEKDPRFHCGSLVIFFENGKPVIRRYNNEPLDEVGAVVLYAIHPEIYPPLYERIEGEQHGH